MVRDGGLADAELGPHDIGELPRGSVSLREELDEAAADRIAEDVESVHETVISLMLDISND
ncbi:hypothetical protein GCM10009775_28760 [Microbacterium aoyamense]|uniref:Uncharacterized protein n=1 Tax=Microbacterium aoyamense TaxID=344166 RepID=A0ABN2PVL6_9MICO